MYIYNQKQWPNFTWNDEQLSDLLISVRHQQGLLLGGMRSIGFHYSEEALLTALTQDVVKSSEIEGEFLDRGTVRSSVARHLGMEAAALGPIDRNVEGIVLMTLDATQNYDKPLTQERLFSWHASLFATGYSGLSKIEVAQWRSGPIQVVSGRLGHETVHFEGPSEKRVPKDMEIFIEWCNSKSTIDPVIKAGIAHLWFVTIHPFDDGNGRTARAIGDLFLARSEKTARRFYSLSDQIQRERKGYYEILEATQKGDLDVTAWLDWFLRCLEKAISRALSTLDILLEKSRYWESIAHIYLNERQNKLINLLLEGFEGKLTTSKWAKIAKCSHDTAYRDILDLINHGILAKSSEGGRSSSYLLVHKPTNKSKN